MWNWDKLLPKVAGKANWSQSKRHCGAISSAVHPDDPTKKCITTSDEALVALLCENCGQRFPVLPAARTVILRKTWILPAKNTRASSPRLKQAKRTWEGGIRRDASVLQGSQRQFDPPRPKNMSQVWKKFVSRTFKFSKNWCLTSHARKLALRGPKISRPMKSVMPTLARNLTLIASHLMRTVISRKRRKSAGHTNHQRAKNRG